MFVLPRRKSEQDALRHCVIKHDYAQPADAAVTENMQLIPHVKNYTMNNYEFLFFFNYLFSVYVSKKRQLLTSGLMRLQCFTVNKIYDIFRGE